MSITVNLYYTGVYGNARKFAEEMERIGIADAVRSEKENMAYEYFISMKDPETILLIDRWENQEALDLHHASNIMADIATLREKYDLHMRVERFVLDEVGMSDSDEQYIRK